MRYWQTEKASRIVSQFFWRNDATDLGDTPRGLKVVYHEVQEFFLVNSGINDVPHLFTLKNPFQFLALPYPAPKLAIMVRNCQKVFYLPRFGFPPRSFRRHAEASNNADRLDKVEPVAIQPRRKCTHTVF
jgi:hypothetical protein